MSIGVSGGPEFVSAIHLRHRRFTYGSASSSELPKSLAAGRPAPTLRGGRDLVVFLGLCSDRNRTKAIKIDYIKMMPVVHQTRW